MAKQGFINYKLKFCYTMDENWKTYEEVATYLLNNLAEELNLVRVEGKQLLLGKLSSTNWEIDAKGFRKGDDGIVIIECKRNTKKKQSQAVVASLGYTITDTGAKSGIIVSPLGLQKGAKLIAKAEEIISIELHENSTVKEFSMKFLNKIFMGHQIEAEAAITFESSIERVCKICQTRFIVLNKEYTCPSCIPIK